MSRFDDLCAAYRTVLDQFVDYRENCFRLVNELQGGLTVYLGAPDDVVGLFARHGQLAGRKVDGPLSALELRADTFWHFGLVIDIYQEEGCFPYHNVGFDMRLKLAHGQFLLQLDEQPIFEIPDGPAADRVAGLTRVFESIEATIQSRYEKAFENFFEEGDATARFGF